MSSETPPRPQIVLGFNSTFNTTAPTKLNGFLTLERHSILEVRHSIAQNRTMLRLDRDGKLYLKENTNVSIEYDNLSLDNMVWRDPIIGRDFNIYRDAEFVGEETSLWTLKRTQMTPQACMYICGAKKFGFSAFTWIQLSANTTICRLGNVGLELARPRKEPGVKYISGMVRADMIATSQSCVEIFSNKSYSIGPVDGPQATYLTPDSGTLKVKQTNRNASPFYFSFTHDRGRFRIMVNPNTALTSADNEWILRPLNLSDYRQTFLLERHGISCSINDSMGRYLELNGSELSLSSMLSPYGLWIVRTESKRNITAPPSGLTVCSGARVEIDMPYGFLRSTMPITIAQGGSFVVDGKNNSLTLGRVSEKMEEAGKIVINGKLVLTMGEVRGNIQVAHGGEAEVICSKINCSMEFNNLTVNEGSQFAISASSRLTVRDASFYLHRESKMICRCRDVSFISVRMDIFEKGLFSCENLEVSQFYGRIRVPYNTELRFETHVHFKLPLNRHVIANDMACNTAQNWKKDRQDELDEKMEITARLEKCVMEFNESESEVRKRNICFNSGGVWTQGYHQKDRTGVIDEYSGQARIDIDMTGKGSTAYARDKFTRARIVFNSLINWGQILVKGQHWSRAFCQIIFEKALVVKDDAILTIDVEHLSCPIITIKREVMVPWRQIRQLHELFSGKKKTTKRTDIPLWDN